MKKVLLLSTLLITILSTACSKKETTPEPQKPTEDFSLVAEGMYKHASLDFWIKIERLGENEVTLVYDFGSKDPRIYTPLSLLGNSNSIAMKEANGARLARLRDQRELFVDLSGMSA